MGSRGPLPRVEHGLVLLTNGKPAKRGVPPPPAELGPAARRDWRRFWAGRMAQHVDRQAHLAALHDWILARDELYRLRPVIAQTPVVTGSRKQLMLNPLVSRAEQVSRTIRELEKAFGMTPGAEIRLALAGVQGQLSAEQLNQMIGATPPAPSASDDEWEQA